ncbi:tape measure protein [Parabacteroides johnsonii]|uniref:tape measure protein n=1 Tax=Parabacteroides johnsonii TaxID=387661 RepID=UPI0024300339|nr:MULTISPECIES: tape measure protein [Bacteroidales]
MADGQMNIRVNVDLNDMRRKAEEYRKEVTKMGVITDESGNVISTAWMRMKQAATAYLGMDIVKRIAMTRGEFQQLEVAFKTLLGAEEPALNLMNQLVETAATTPFDLKGVADGARQLLAYGFAADEINDTLIRLGNVAAGLGLPLERLTYLYGTTAVQGRLYAIDMLQFQSSGIPVLQELSKMYGKTTSEINDMVTAGKIGFDDIKKVFEGMTNEGGKFYALMEGQSKTIIGQISNLSDAIDMMFNEIGQANEGIISDAISGASYLVENYEKVLSILKVLVATYGTYKASLIAVAAAQRVSVTIQNISAWISLAKAIRTAKDAQIAFNLATKANPYVLLATVLIGVGTALYQFTKKTDAATDALKKFNEESKKNADDTATFITITRDENQSIAARQLALDSLRKMYPGYFDNMNLEALKVINLTELNNQLAKATRERSKAQAEESIKETEKSINSIKQQIDFLNKNAVQGRGERLIRANKQLQELQDKLAEQHSILNKVNSDIKAQEDAERRAKEEAEAHAKSVEKTVKWYEEQIKTLKEAQETSTTNKQFNDYQRQIDQLTKEKETITGASKATQKAEEERIKTIKQIDEELLFLRKQNQQAQIDLMQEGTEKELAQIRLDYQEKIAEIKKLADDWAAKQGGTLTIEQTVQISTSYSTVKQKREQDESDVYKKQTDELNELLKQYQSYQQQHLDIERKYNKDIEKLQEELAKTTEESERNRLEESIRVAKEKKKTELSGLDLEQFQKEIDWSSVFGNLDKLSTDALKKLRDKIKEYLSTVDDSISKEDFKTVVDAFENLDATITNREPLEELVSGYRDYRKAVEEVTKAKKEMDKADNPEAKERAVKNLSAAEKKRAESINKMTQSVNAIGQQGQQVISAGNDLVDMLTNLGIKVPESISRTLSGLGQVMDGLAEIDLTKPMSAVTGVIHVLAGVTKTIGSIFGLGSDNGVAQYKALREQLEAINDLYKKIIDKSKEKIVFGGGFASVEAAKEANEALEKQIENYRRLAEVGGKAGSSAGAHSYAYRANERLKKSWNDISRSIGQNISSVQQMYELSGEQLEIIRRDFPEAWSKIPSEITENLDAIIDCNDEAKELANTLQEALTGISFDSFYNGFIDSLSDMDASFEDMCDDFEGYLRKSIIAGLIASQYKGRIENLYKSWTEAAESENKITAKEAEKLRDDYQDIIQDMIKDRDNLAKTFNWESSPEELKRQTGTISETITEKTANESMGIWRGSYDTLKAISQQTTIFHETYKSTMATCNSILNTIARNTGETANNTSVLSDMHNTLKNMDGRLRTIESESSKRYAR